ncbi:hypothetical protein MNEG_4726 [Monoraphidium neglectum]|uniref:Uncharacterized protein n=1 Tax=Monoraphidium neglectum TaxID=145388 RepID=A0A0D2L8S3_9CHLO|nr:hypothetical protein MNEG_4726 [Monoraphidium neglectum]KIZ03229.1 hypothetical protein MNEG_4726 [Monoraphidium neglectum]|eukprot:XP_013902248.1 hypothetical protein MNEG_4726 [Monoraphidium neglectum]
MARGAAQAQGAAQPLAQRPQSHAHAAAAGAAAAAHTQRPTQPRAQREVAEVMVGAAHMQRPTQPRVQLPVVAEKPTGPAHAHAAPHAPRVQREQAQLAAHAPALRAAPMVESAAEVALEGRRRAGATTTHAAADRGTYAADIAAAECD